jgi:hypothetical protein
MKSMKAAASVAAFLIFLKTWFTSELWVLSKKRTTALKVRRIYQPLYRRFSEYIRTRAAPETPVSAS